MKIKNFLTIITFTIVLLLSACNEKTSSVLSSVSSNEVSSMSSQSSEIISSSNQESAISSESSVVSSIIEESTSSSNEEVSSVSSEETISSLSESIPSSEVSSISSEEITSSISESVSSSEEVEDSYIDSEAHLLDHIASKGTGITLDAFTEDINKLNTKATRKVRYTYHIVEKITGNFYKVKLDGTQMEEGELVGDFVSEPKDDNNSTYIKVISGTPVTAIQKYFAQDYTSAINPSGWLAYHKQKRTFLNYAQEGEGFVERFYNDPIKMWMMSWGNRPANAQMDGVYFGFDEFERVYDEDGYCTTFTMREYTYMKGTLSTYNSSKDYDGSYEYTCQCTFEYLDSIDDDSFDPSSFLPEREEGVSLETFTEEINTLEPQTNDRKIRITYHIVETLDGTMPYATYKNGSALPQGETVTDVVLESRNSSASDLKLISGELNTRFSQVFQSGIIIGIKNWLSYHKERRDAVNREAMPEWNVFNESLELNPFKMWMVESGTRPPNAGVEGTYFAFNEYERTFDENGYCKTILFREFTYIDGVFSRWDTDPQYYKGTFDAIATATIEYLDIE